MTERIPLTGGKYSFADLAKMIRQSGNYTGRAKLTDAEIIELLKITEGLMGGQMKKLTSKAEGGLLDEGGSVDPVSGNDVPIGSTKEEVRDDIPAQLSEGEFVFPADVVRYIGLEKLMMMRQEAKQGLKKMEAMGQMGNSDEATVPDDLPFNETDIIAEDDDGNEVEMAEGGLTPSSKYNQFMGGAGIRQVVYVNPKTGDEILVYVVSGTPIPAVPLGYVPKGSEQASTDAITESKLTNAIEPPENIQEDKDETYTVFNGKIVNPGADIALTGGDSSIQPDTWADLEAESMFGKAVDQSKAPAGWTTQNQREYNKLKEKGNVKAMWNGKEWDVYSPDPAFAGSAFGKPGTRGLKSKYGNIFENIKTGFSQDKKEGEGFSLPFGLGVVSKIAQANNKKMEDNVDDTFDAYTKRKTVATSAGKGPGTRKPRPLKPKAETELKNLGINKTKSTAPANQTSDDDDKFREERRRQQEEKGIKGSGLTEKQIKETDDIFEKSTGIRR
jgi:hypothetical protein